MGTLRLARPPVLLSVLLATSLAGCLQDGPDAAAGPDHAGPDADMAAPDGRDLGRELLPEDQVPAPFWHTGDWWGIHVYYGSEGGEGSHINAIVTESDANGHVLATDDRQVAKLHALRDYPVLGPVDAADLSTTAFGGAWDWFSFPMTDGATWTGEIPNIAFDVLPAGQVPVWFTATYTPSLDVAGEKLPGYTVDGVLDDGTLVVTYTYAPSVGWMTSATVYDIDPEQDPVEFRMTLMGHGRNWTGTFYQTTAALLIDNVDGAGFTDIPTEGGEPFVEPSPHGTFTVSDDATYLFGYVFNGAIAGARTTLLIPPEGEPRRYEAVGAPQQATEVLIDEPALPGEWRLATAGAGALTLSEVFLVELVEHVGGL